MSASTCVCILDYGSGNVRSVANLFESLQVRVLVSNDVHAIRRASHIVLPGVGAFGAAMSKISATLPVEAMEHDVLQGGKPFLGICVGMQVLADRGSEFGEHTGLGWIPGTVGLLNSDGLRLPHMGWNDVTSPTPEGAFEGLEQGREFYFVHSYVMTPADPADILASARYGVEFCAAVRRNNIVGVQFHPEKSQDAGRTFVQSFLEIT